MKKKECPSCAMAINSNEKVCPICGYEFAEQGKGMQWVAILLVVVIVFYLILRIF